MSSTEQALAIAGIAAAATIAAAVIAAASAYFATIRDRRRVLYGEAFKAALGWVEMLYRVRRRSGSDDPSINERFHTLQEALTYYEGWIASESPFMARSYRRLVAAVKAGTQPLIQEAWKPPVNGKTTETGIVDGPIFRSESDAFMKDVRGYLSPWHVRKIAVAWRNRMEH